MLHLKLEKAPYWIDLAGGVSVEVMPASSLMMLEVRDGIDLPEGEVDVTTSTFVLSYGKALARAAIVGWKGVLGADDDPAPVTPENVDALMDIYQCYLGFRDRYITPALTLAAEGNGFAPSPNGTSAAAQDTAKAAPDAATTAPPPPTAH